MAALSQWRRAYAEQARADLAARESLLRSPNMPACQQLHFLQMACEKICKAFLCGQGVDPAALRTSHAYIAGPLPIIARQQFVAAGSRHADRSWMLKAIRTLARKVELLSPAVDAGGRQPANCEYPWETSAGAVVAPASHDFGIDLLASSGGRHFLKVLYKAADDLLAEG